MKSAAVFVMFFLATVTLFVGFHNIDNAWNMSGECWDTSLAGVNLAETDLYQLGILQMFFSLALFFSAVFISEFWVNKTAKSLNPKVAQ